MKSFFRFLIVLVPVSAPLLAQPVITNQPASHAVWAGGNVTFTVGVSSAGPVTYQWQFNNTDLPNGIITTVAGNGTNGYSGDGSAATNANLDTPPDMAVDASGNLFIADYLNNCIRKVNSSGIITTVAGNGTGGYSGDGSAATNANLDPTGVAVDASGNLFIADWDNDVIRKVSTNGIITTVAGNTTWSYSGDGGAATNASLNYPGGVAVDASGNLFIADTYNHRIRRVNTNGIIATVAGNGTGAYSGDGSAATNASLNDPQGVAVDASGNLFIADYGNSRIRKVSANGIITTVAGNGLPDYSGDGGAATNASLNDPQGVAVDASGNLFIADLNNNVIRKVSISGIITTVAGNGSPGYSGDGGAATNADLNYPYGVAVDTFGNLFIADTFNNCIRKVNHSQGPTLALFNVTAANAGDYQVVVTGFSGSVTSSVATLIVASITSQPASCVNVAGTTATFSVIVGGITSPSYQWQKNGVVMTDGGNISGSTAATLTLSNVQDADAASYVVVVTNVTGSITSSPAMLTVVEFTAQPASQAVWAGGNVTFVVGVSSTGPITYQWQFNNTNLPEVSTNQQPALMLNNVTAANAGVYQVVVTGGAGGSVTSSVATLTVATITSQPASRANVTGTTATFSVAVGGIITSSSYQWLKNGVVMTDGGNVSGSTAATLTLSNVQDADAAGYSVVVTNVAGSVTSSVASLVVLGSGNRILFQWSFDGIAGNPMSTCADAISGVVLTSFSSGLSATIAYGASNPWYNTNGTSAVFQNTPGANTTGVGLFANDTGVNGPLDISVVTNLTLEAFIFPYDVRQAVIVRKDGGTGGYYIDERPDGHFGLSLKSASQDLTDQLECNDLPYTPNQWYHVAMVWDGAGVTFYVNGVQSHDLGVNHMAVVPFTGPVGDSTDSLGVGAFVQDNANPPANSSQFFYGQIDEVRISNAALPPGQFLINHGDYTGPPVIIAQPQNVTVPAGLNPNFIASAVGPGLNWQWRFNNTNIISGATNYFCQLANVSSASAGYYSVTISNAYGFTNSQNARLTVTPRSWQSGLAFNYSSNGKNMPYRLYLPINYNPATNYPLVIFLHGSGQCGSDNVAQVANWISGLITRTYSQYPAILVAPQVIDYWSPYNPNDLTLGILAQVKRNYSVDDRRIYLTGLSLGGFGTTLYAFYFPTLFAAIAPMSGAYNFSGEEPVIPTWLFHGSDDTTVPVSASETYYTDVTGLSDIVFTQTNYSNPTAVSGPIRFTEFMGQDHAIWGLIYGASFATDLYDWMFSQTPPPSTSGISAAFFENDQFIMAGFNSVPLAAGCLLTSTNLQTPRSQWQPIATNWCDAYGNLMFTTKIDAGAGQRFYLLQFQ